MAYSITKVRYENGKLFLNMYDDVVDKRGPATAYFHEFGHQIDDKLKWKFTQDSELMRHLNDDFNDIQVNSIIDVINTNDKASSVSDILGALSGGAISGKYFHRNEYWEESSNITGEFFAHVIEAQFDSERRKFLAEAFPKSYNYVISKLEEV